MWAGRLPTPMSWYGSESYTLTSQIFQRALGSVYLIAFINALNQFQPLLGDRGLLPVRLYARNVTFADSPSLFLFFPHDRAFAIGAWAGVVLSALVFTGVAGALGSWVSALVWALIWILYLSFVNVGQTFYAFGWESILLEVGFYAIFLGGNSVKNPVLVIWLIRWLLFRVMFGAGLIKLRGDPCWRDLTCLDYHYETQPMPNPLSWFFFWGPEWTKKGGVLFNHFSELIVPFAYFLPQPLAAVAGLITILFQLTIFVSGNLSWLNYLTVVLAISTLDDSFFARLGLRAQTANPPLLPHRVIVYSLAALVAYLSIQPVRNMISPDQVMNTVYNRLHLVGTYGAFGSITRPRYEVIVEGTGDAVLTGSTQWREYEFKGKPGATGRIPPQFAPYHLRLDWLMWFAALSSYSRQPWFVNFVAKLLENDRPILSLLGTNPFPDAPPKYVRAQLYEYHFTTPQERSRTGQWWKRELVRQYFPPVSLRDEGFRDLLERQGWLEAAH